VEHSRKRNGFEKETRRVKRKQNIVGIRETLPPINDESKRGAEWE